VPSDIPTALTPPDQFLTDKVADVVAIVAVQRVETRWLVLADGDHLPVLVVACRMEEGLAGFAGAQEWPVGATQLLMQADYSELNGQPIAPPAIEGRRYLLWALRVAQSPEARLRAPWQSLPQGLLLVRGAGGSELVFWNGKRYSLAALRAAVKSGRRLPLDEIADPVRRIEVAEERMRRHAIDNEKAFIHGLLLNVVDPEGQARRVESEPATAAQGGETWMRGGSGQPHALWFQSLALLRDLGRDERYKHAVIDALTPVARQARPKIRLAAALALVDLGSDAGRNALIEGYQSESGEVSSEPPDPMTLPGRYPYDRSSVTACAHALARLNDRRGLGNPNPEVKLAAAAALADRPDDELCSTLRALALQLQPSVEKLAADGVLSRAREPGDQTLRYPSAWVATQSLLARAGDAESLRRLVEAYLLDARTYPTEEAQLVPRLRMARWSGGPSLEQAIRAADASPGRVLARLHALYVGDPRWTGELAALRGALGDPSLEQPKAPAPHTPDERDVAKLLASPDPERRAEGWAAAGFHNLGSLYDRVLEVALHGAGIEKSAAIYALGFYDREVPEPALTGC